MRKFLLYLLLALTTVGSVNAQPHAAFLAFSKKSVVFDADAQAYFTAQESIGVTLTAGQKHAWNNFVVWCKSKGLWSPKAVGAYPLMGGTAAAHKWNAKDPRDLDAAYRLVFNAGFTHASTGVAGNGTTGYAQTFITPSTLTTDSWAIAIYSRTTGNNTGYDCGGANTTSSIIRVSARLSGSAMSNMFSTTTTNLTAATAEGTGIWIWSKTATDHTLYRNGSVVATASGSAGTVPSREQVLWATISTGGAVQSFSSREFGIVMIFKTGLTSTEASDLYTGINTFITAISR